MRLRGLRCAQVMWLLAGLGILWSGLAHALSLPGGEFPAAGPYAYVTNYSSNTVSVVNTANNTVSATIPVGSGPYGVAVHPNGTTVYVTNYAGSSVSVIDAATNLVTATIPVATHPYGIDVSPDGSRLYIAAYSSNSVTVIDTSTNLVVATVPVGASPRAVVVSHDGSRVYVANFAANSISVIDPVSNAVAATVTLPAGSGPIGLMLTPDNQTLYVTAYSSGKVYVIDAVPNAVKTFIPVGTRPWGIAITPDGKTIYVGNYSGSISAPTSISVIDPVTNIVSANIPLPAGVFPSGVAVHPDGTHVYAASYSTGVVYIIDEATHTILKSTPVGTRPYAFGNFLSTPQPGVTLWHLLNNGFYNNPYNQIELEYFGQCAILSCWLDPNYYSTYQLDATLNGQLIGSQFKFRPGAWFGRLGGGQSIYTPLTRLPEGLNTFNFRVTDRYGHTTPLQTVTFTIDTIAPKFLSLIPPDGSMMLDPNVTVSGSIDDATGYVLGDGSHLAPGVAYSQPGPNFSFPMILTPGANLLSLQALDRAGNTANATLHLTYVPFALTITGPQSGITISAPQVTVSGTYSGASGATVSVNGVAATVTGTNFSAANVPLLYGFNLLVATGTRAADGKVATQTIPISSSALVLTLSPPALGGTVAASSVAVTGTVNGPFGTSVIVNGVAATVSGTSYSATVPITYGNNILTAIATVPTGATATQTLNIVGTVPTLIIAKPVPNATLTAAPALVTGTLSGPTGTTVSVNGIPASVMGTTFSASVPLVYGSNTLTATATTPSGQTVSQSVTITSLAPVLAFTAPAANTTLSGTSVTVSGTFQGAAGATVSVNGIAASMSGNVFTVSNVPVGYGSNTLTATATAPDGSTATATLMVTGAIPVLQITSPTGGAAINGNTVLVTGTLQGPPNTGVTVNGVVASVDGGNFYANNVPLQPGANTLTVAYTTLDGVTASKTIGVSSTGMSPFQVTATDYVGLAPMLVNLNVANQTSNPILSVNVVPGGTGSLGSITASGSSATIPLTYATPGTYLATVTVTDVQGTHSQTVAITVMDPGQMDTMFGAIWNGMNNALVAGDKAKALIYLNTSAQTKYAPVFSALLPTMPQIVASYSPLQRFSISSDIGEYAVNRVLQGVNRIYLIYFLRDTDGVWRIDSL